MAITIREIIEASKSRAMKWHGANGNWSLLEWAGAMAGEAGEAANVAKKIKRIECGMNNIPTDKQTKETKVELHRKLACEAADTILYGILVIQEAGYDAEIILKEVFNNKSIEYDFPERL